MASGFLPVLPLTALWDGAPFTDGPAGETLHQISHDFTLYFYSGALPDRSSIPARRTTVICHRPLGVWHPKKERKLTIFLSDLDPNTSQAALNHTIFTDPSSPDTSMSIDVWKVLEGRHCTDAPSPCISPAHAHARARTHTHAIAQSHNHTPVHTPATAPGLLFFWGLEGFPKWQSRCNCREAPHLDVRTSMHMHAQPRHDLAAMVAQSQGGGATDRQPLA
jgi:hypothetical protein